MLTEVRYRKWALAQVTFMWISGVMVIIAITIGSTRSLHDKLLEAQRLVDESHEQMRQLTEAVTRLSRQVTGDFVKSSRLQRQEANALRVEVRQEVRKVVQASEAEARRSAEWLQRFREVNPAFVQEAERRQAWEALVHRIEQVERQRAARTTGVADRTSDASNTP